MPTIDAPERLSTPGVFVRLPWGKWDADRHDVSAERIRELRHRALRARDLAAGVFDKQVEANLLSYAKDLEAEALKLEAQPLPSAALDDTPQQPSTGPQVIAAIKPEPDAEPGKSEG